MATFTQDKQPYGPITRREYVVDGIHYAIRRAEGVHLQGLRKWELRRYPDPMRSGSEVDAFVLLPPDATIHEAKRRLLGK